MVAAQALKERVRFRTFDDRSNSQNGQPSRSSRASRNMSVSARARSTSSPFSFCGRIRRSCALSTSLAAFASHGVPVDWAKVACGIGGLLRGGFHRLPGWTPRREVSTWNPPRKSLLLRGYFWFRGWTPTGVASQKNRSDASEVARFAPQHTFSAGKEPYNQWVSGFS